MRRFSERQAMHTLAELNVTPLLDLAFVLLIIFMITTPLMDNSVDLVVPSSEAAAKAVDPSAVQTVSINRDAVLKLNGAPTTLAAMEAQLKELKAARSEVAVVIRSHKELPVQKLIDVMDVVQRAKIMKVGVVTTHENP
ncbi:MAG TPA: biopolymer transporter ExbD [Chthoniobacteraceae bacterium]|nr:biopolymer transporter ExbD [Chthoniobacteraceae bacterium]